MIFHSPLFRYSDRFVCRSLLLDDITITLPVPPRPVVELPDVPFLGVIIDWNVLITEQYELTITGAEIVDNQLVFDGGDSCELEFPENDICIGFHPECSSLGFSYSFNVSFTSYQEGMFFISTGAEADGCGVSFFYRYGKFQYIVTTQTEMWVAESATVGLDEMNNFVISWQREEGLRVSDAYICLLLIVVPVLCIT